MGYNTTVFILNDRLDEIQKHAERFVEQVTRAASSLASRDTYIIGQTTVMRSEHADMFRIYATQANAITDLGRYSEDFRRAESDPLYAAHMLDRVERALRELRATRTALQELRHAREEAERVVAPPQA